MAAAYTLESHGDYWAGRFTAMASPCEILCDLDDATTAQQLTELACAEAQRIEQKFSRYRDDNIIYQINHSAGKPVAVDDETAALLDFAAQCYHLSDGKFDITSGILRRVWRFDVKNSLPSTAQVRALLGLIGWSKLSWQRPWLTLPAGMELDFGGIGKEYAVDKTALILQRHTAASLLINFGGDLLATGPRRNGQGWVVGLEDPRRLGTQSGQRHTAKEFELVQGAIATSGDTQRYIMHKGVRYSHILNPHDGWPVLGAPHSVSVVAGTCTDAGILATLAMLQGKQAEKFLRKQKVKFWCLR